jgi:fructuronate reductase
MERYRNSALGHQTAQVAMDGSQKLPLRLPPIAEAALDRGHEPRATALAYAAWMVFLARGATVDGRPLRIDDPRADELCAAARGGEATLVERFLRLPGVFSDRLVAEPTWRELLEDAVARFRSATPADWARLE